MKTSLTYRPFYLLCALPALGSFGTAPPLSKQGFWALVTESEGPADIVRALLLGDDLLQRETVLAGEIEPDQAEVAILSLHRQEEPLPDFLLTEHEDQGEESRYRIPADLLWERYFRYTLKIARSAHSRFLGHWAGYEVGLRNAMAFKRAEALGLDPGPYLVAQELADPGADFGIVLTQWSGASNPLAALEALDRARWDWLTENEPWYCFSDDEVAAYTAKLMLLQRWHRISNS